MSRWKQPIPTDLEDIFNKDYGCQLLYRELIYRSANRDGFFTYGKKTTPIKRGQVVFGRKQWSAYLQQSGTTLRYWLIKLEKVYNLIDNQSNSNYTLVTIKNYEEDAVFDNQVDKQLTGIRQVTDTSKSVKSEKKIHIEKKIPKEKNAKTGHYPCTEEELKYISNLKHVSLKDVRETHESFMNRVKDGTAKQYGNTTYYTVENWVQLGIKRGNIHKYSDSDWEDEMLLAQPIPPKIQAWFKTLE